MSNRQARRAAGAAGGVIDLATARPLGQPGDVQLMPVHDPINRGAIDNLGGQLHDALILHASVSLLTGGWADSFDEAFAQVMKWRMDLPALAAKLAPPAESDD